ncbi:MAG TPA: tetratricopeptide repeat protein [Xanthobacteraceae bacterium]|nr:tetratricopeptide repeat protein [Xanthobacteraceae bacterium]
MQQRSERVPGKSPIAALLAATMLAGALGGCAAFRSVEPSSSLAATASPGGGEGGRKAVDSLAERYETNPGDPKAAIAYAQELRKNGQRAQAVAVLEQSSLRNPTDMELLGAYGRALADVGNFQQALDVLTRAHTPDHPDWRILSAQGAVLDQMGRHNEAQRYYETALKIVPDEPTVLSNLGLSYALSKDLPRAEATLKRAAAGGNVDPRVRQNLALVVGLQGRFAEAETIARADLPPDEAAANVAYLRDMLSRENGTLKGGRISAADGNRRG